MCLHVSSRGADTACYSGRCKAAAHNLRRPARHWRQDAGRGRETVDITVEGPVGQRLGSMGMPGTEITVNGSVSDDVGWLNCGAKITVLGDATNGAWNAAAQGTLYVRKRRRKMRHYDKA